MTCYTRHEVAPGAHQDIPHEVCMTSGRIDLDTPGVRNVPGLDYPQGTTLCGETHGHPNPTYVCPAPAGHDRANREAGIQHDGDFPEHCPLYCTKHNHEEMGG